MQLSLNFKARDQPAEVLKALTSIPEGTHLYNVLAKASPTAPWKHLGKVFTRSRSVTSAFGDARLSFRHQRMEEDFMWNPNGLKRQARTKPCVTIPQIGLGTCARSPIGSAPYALGVPPI